MSAPTYLYSQFLEPESAWTAYHYLLDNLVWERRDTTPRCEYWCSTLGEDYTYGVGAGQRTYKAHEMIHVVDHIGGLAANWFECAPFEGCFLNLYMDGRDALGWHADDDPKIDHDRPIAVVTLGASRDIQFKSMVSGSHPETVALTHGSLLFMNPGMQQTHFHRIPKIKHGGENHGMRISLTYRGLKR